MSAQATNRSPDATHESLAVITEQRLVAHYLRTDGGFGGTPLRFIDATADELVAALGCAADPLPFLASACGSSGDVEHLFAYGPLGKWPDKESPGYFRHLVLTCAITARAVTNKDTRNFRVNLAAAFGRRDPFNNLNALPKLWQGLQHWCARQRKEGKPLRVVTLPASPSYKFVGYSQDMTFPAWRDVVHLRTVASREIDFQTERDTDRTTLQLARIVDRNGDFTEAMHRVAAEYLKYHQAGAVLLPTHPFRAAALAVLQSQAPRTGPTPPSLRIELRIQLDVEDAELTLHLNRPGVTVDTQNPTHALVGSPEEVMPKVAGWLRDHRLLDARLPVIGILRGGLIPFFEERFGLWVAGDRVPEVPLRCRILWKAAASALIAKLAVRSHRLGPLWRVTDVLSPADVRYLFGALSLAREPAARSAEYLRLVGGFETPRGYLGRPALLPRIWAPAKCMLSLNSASAEVEAVGLLATGGGYHVPDTALPLEGRFRLRLEEQVEGADPLSQERNLAFVADAPEHLEYKTPNVERWETVLESIVMPLCIVAAPAPPDATASVERGLRDARFDDLLEAIYARGQGGWSEFELIPTIQGVLGPDAPSPWDVLRSLEESGWMRPVYAIAWGVRRWWLVRPHLLAVWAADDLVVLSGSTTAAVRSRFKGIAERLGGVVAERPGVGPYSPPTVSVRGVAAKKLADETEWQLTQHVRGDCSPAPACWPSDGCDPASHQLVEVWNWDDLKFRTLAATGHQGSVAVERYRRERGDRRDVFRVRGGGEPDWIGWSRVVAIAEAYRRSREHFLRAEGELLARIPTDGYLPLTLAERLWRAALRHGGPVGVPGAWHYAYAGSEVAQPAIHDVFGSRFVFNGTIPASDGSISRLIALGAARHRPHLRAGAVLYGRSRSGEDNMLESEKK